MEIIGDNYSVIYKADIATIFCKGALWLYGNEGYLDIANLFNNVADLKPKTITLDVSELKFLNSAGINTISKFVIRVRNLKCSQMVIRGSKKFPWQSKSLEIMQRLFNGLILEIN